MTSDCAQEKKPGSKDGSLSPSGIFRVPPKERLLAQPDLVRLLLELGDCLGLLAVLFSGSVLRHPLSLAPCAFPAHSLLLSRRYHC